MERFTSATGFKKEWSGDDVSVILLQFKFQELVKMPGFCFWSILVVDHNCSTNFVFVQIVLKLSFCSLLSKVRVPIILDILPNICNKTIFN